MQQPHDFDPAAAASTAFLPVAVMRCAQRLHHEAPRQPRRDGSPAPGGFVVVRQGLQNLLRDLGGFSHVWLLFHCHLSRGYNDLVQPPRDERKRGLFATRSPTRPNAIGLSAVALLGIHKRVLSVGPHDLLDDTPILDIKPYIPAYDAIGDARAGYVEGLDPQADDHRAWWRSAAKAPPRIYRERGVQ
ncbi:MAG: SAM-dependent methyltransferase [Planctomycetota bacterium]